MQNQSNLKFFEENHITSFAVNKSGQYCAVGFHKNHEARIYKMKSLNDVESWQMIQQMKEHTQTISDIDWSNDDKIMTTSHDRSVVVWKRNGNKWNKMLVNIDIKLSIICGKWAPSSKKFALGSSCQTIAIGFFNTETLCWTASTREKFVKSPVTAVSFHPSSNILAVGSSDYSVTIITCNFKKSDNQSIKKSDIEDKNYQGPFQHVDTLFETLVKVDDVGGWVNYLSFQKNGTALLVLPHSNHFKVYDLSEGKGNIDLKQTDIKWKGLPFLSGFIGDNQIVVGGFDRKVAIFGKTNNGYEFKDYLEKNQKTNTVQKKGLVSGLMAGIVKKATSLYGELPSNSQHFNNIQVFNQPKYNQIISYDINGHIHFWIR